MSSKILGSDSQSAIIDATCLSLSPSPGGRFCAPARFKVNKSMAKPIIRHFRWNVFIIVCRTSKPPRLIQFARYCGIIVEIEDTDSEVNRIEMLELALSAVECM